MQVSSLWKVRTIGADEAVSQKKLCSRGGTTQGCSWFDDIRSLSALERLQRKRDFFVAQHPGNLHREQVHSLKYVGREPPTIRP